MWGKNFYTHLSDVYQNQAFFTVMFVSDAHRKKLWTNHERKSAQARAFTESRESILPAFFDETVEVLGLLKTTGHMEKFLNATSFASCIHLSWLIGAIARLTLDIGGSMPAARPCSVH